MPESERRREDMAFISNSGRKTIFKAKMQSKKIGM